MKEEKQLQVGDKLYRTSHYKTIDRVVTIERVTNTQAISGHTKFKRTLNGNEVASVVGDSSWSVHFWQLESEELKERLFRQTAIKQLKEFDYSKVSTEIIKHILQSLTTPK